MEKTAVPRGKRPRVQVSLDDKERAIARIRNGETKAGISRELGVPESTVRGWVKRAEQRLAREAADQQGPKQSASALQASSSTPLALQSLKLPQKRDFNGNMRPSVTMLMSSAAHALPQPLSFPMQVFNQAAESQLQVLGWLHIFNAGILNFTLITTAALMQANARGISERVPLWQIIGDFVEEAGRIAAANGNQYTAPPLPQSPRAVRPLAQARPSFVAPRVHITAEDDDEEEQQQSIVEA